MSAPTVPPHETSDVQHVVPIDDDVIAVHHCSRIGLRANPPRRRLFELLFPSRQR